MVSSGEEEPRVRKAESALKDHGRSEACGRVACVVEPHCCNENISETSLHQTAESVNRRIRIRIVRILRGIPKNPEVPDAKLKRSSESRSNKRHRRQTDRRTDRQTDRREPPSAGTRHRGRRAGVQLDARFPPASVRGGPFGKGVFVHPS
ncbi:hypothetical protein Q8A67_014113 [Cirrhinus molitorella]|uniref:Uncharacterized protein n=1 Tax=Cirrhinus molitorella TaxID=172907 RepID=A0AA88PJ31_9TELE|nr:hypothetical protein Q8A67_014113 [Cirrhinus molitorella]